MAMTNYYRNPVSGYLTVFVETADGFFGTEVSANANTRVDTTGAKQVAAAVPVRSGYRCGGWTNPAGTATNYGILTKTASSSTVSYPNAQSGTQQTSVTVLNAHGTHTGTVSGNYSFGCAVGVRLASVDDGWKFTGWKVTRASTASSAGSLLSKGGTTSGAVTMFPADYDAAVVFQLGTANYPVTFEATYERDAPVPVTRTLTYDRNGGDSTPPSQTGTAGQTIVLAGPISRSGWNFTHWLIGGKPYAAGAEYTFGDADVTAVAQWSQVVTRTVSFAKGSQDVGGPSIPSITRESGTTVVLPSPDDWSYADHVFAGWSDGHRTYAAGAEFEITSDVTMTATWSEASASGARYDTHSEWAGRDWTYQDSGYNLRVSTSVPIAQDRDSIIISYQDGSKSGVYDKTLRVGADDLDSLLVITTPASVKKEFLKQGSVISINDVCPDSAVWEAPDVPGYDWVGWYTTNESYTSSTVVVYKSDYGLLVTSKQSTTWGDLRERINWLRYLYTHVSDGNVYNHTEKYYNYLRAVYRAKTLRIVFSSNRGTGAPPPMTVSCGTSFRMPATYPSRERYRFLGWSEDKDAVSPDYVLGTDYEFPADRYDDGEDITLYAVWEYNGVIVTFSPCGGTVGTRYIVALSGEPYGTLPTPVRDGYEFAGWYTAASGGSVVTASTVVTNGNNHALYAHWAGSGPVASHTVTFDPAGGVVSPASMTVTEGVAFGTLPTPSRSGYTFVGWFPGISWGDQVTPDSIAGDEDQTLYARWTGIPIVIIFDPNGGTVTKTSKTIENGRSIGLLPKPVLADHNFDGWYTAADGGVRVTTSFKPTVTTTLFAHWSERLPEGGIEAWVY